MNIFIITTILVIGTMLVLNLNFFKTKINNFFNTQDSEVESEDSEIEESIIEKVSIKKDKIVEELDTEKIEDFFEIDKSEEIEDFFNLENKQKLVNNNVIYLDILKGENKGRVLIELNMNTTPKTATNFLNLIKSEAYNNVPFHRIIKDFMIQGGDTTNHDGTGGRSSFENELFEDENFKLNHDKYVISMANNGPNRNGSQFFITLKETPWLNGKHVVFGKVIKGFDIIEDIGNVETNEKDNPLETIKIIDSGIL